jgi:glycosyltransferase involved in cell wall biosynthesis
MDPKLSIIIICSDNVDANLFSSIRNVSPYEVILVITGENKALNTLAVNNGFQVIVTDGTGRNEGYIKAAKKAKGDVLLFLSGNLVYQPSQLDSFLRPILEGQAEVVLNNSTPSFLKRRVKQWPDSYTLWRQVFNDSLGYRDLNIDSLISMPHAYTQEVLKSIGYESLENLAVAHMRVLDKGWKISRPISFNTTHPGELLTPEQSHYKVPLTDAERVNTRNYLEALAEWHKVHGKRGNYHDGGRKRDIIKEIKKHNSLSAYVKTATIKPRLYTGWGMTSSIYKGKQLSVIIPAQNEEHTIGAVIKEARKIEPLEIIVIVNGSTDNTETIAKQLGATVIVFPEALGHDVGRAIGALEAKGEILLFIDADFSIQASLLHQYTNAVANGVDVALNDLNIDYFPLFIVNLYKYMLNIACDRKDLGVGSLVAVPHALSRSCLKGIGWDSLLNPNLAHVKAILQGYLISNVQFVDVMKPNRIRLDQHFSSTGHPKAVLRINGDHLEAIEYLIKHLESIDEFDS